MFLIPQTKLTKYCLVLACCLTLEFNWIGNSSVGQDPSGPASTSRTTLSDRQTSVAARFEKLQELLLRLAEMEAVENPERAALLRRAARQSSDQFILEKLKTASESLETEEFQKAVENQEAAAKELGSLLTLLMSEDRSERIRAEKDRVQQMVKDLKRTLNNQRSVRARTENGADLEQLEKEQKSVTERGKELSEQMEAGESEDLETESPAATEQESGEQENSESSSDSESSSNSDTQTEQGEENQGKTQETDSEQGENSPEEAKTDPNAEKNASNEQTEENASNEGSEQNASESNPSESNPSESSQSESSQSNPDQSSQAQPPQTPEQQAQQQLEQAIENMQNAEKALEEAKREEATEQQRQAEEELREAIDELEKILRQLREEEMQRELAKLEARLKKMATMQAKLLDDTITLASTPPSQRNRQTDLKAGKLAFEEKKITLEADRAMLLLREEGSSVAFPEVVGQIREDTIRVSELLNETKIDTIAQGIQQDILAALEEMITSLQKAQRDLEQQRQQEQPPGSPPPSGQGEQPLVEAIAELKLIRTMQVRIQGTTNRYADLMNEGNRSIEEVLPLLRDLAERQDRLDQITRDIALERNQ
ncbi:MAG: hypothetical protein ACON5D_14595 [Rubripirellula sp.]